jgi:transposase
MDVYIGMDISLQTVHICAVDGEGNRVREGSARSDVAAVDAWLRQQGKEYTHKRIVFETGPLSASLYHGLCKMGWPVVCIDARHAHGTLKAQRVKNDQNDARGLAQIARTGWYKIAHVKSGEHQALHAFVQGRKQLVHARQTMENHMRGVLKTFGIKLGAVTCKGFRGKVEQEMATQHALVQQTMKALLDARDALLVQEHDMERRCQSLARKDPICQRFMTIPGVGVLTALTYKAEIDDPSRFRKSRAVGAHVGLTPRRYASGEVDYTGRISKCGSDTLRSVLYEASLTMLTRSRKWSRLKAWGVKLAQRSGFKVACTAVARKLAVVMHRMWADATEFAYGTAPTAPAVQAA